MKSKSIKKFARKNVLFISIVVIGLLIVSWSAYNIFLADPTYIYAKVKVSQGYWWASTVKPKVWYLQNIKPGLMDKDVTGKVKAEILDLTYYPNKQSTFDIFLTVKLKTNKQDENKYSFNGELLAVAAPIEIELPNVAISGTVTEISKTEIENKFISKKITLLKKYADRWEYDGIQIGDKYFNGKEPVFEITNKKIVDTEKIINTISNQNIGVSSNKISIEVQATVRVEENEFDQFVLAEEQVLVPGKKLVMSTSNFNFTKNGYFITEIE